MTAEPEAMTLVAVIATGIVLGLGLRASPRTESWARVTGLVLLAGVLAVSDLTTAVAARWIATSADLGVAVTTGHPALWALLAAAVVAPPSRAQAVSLWGVQCVAALAATCILQEMILTIREWIPTAPELAALSPFVRATISALLFYIALALGVALAAIALGRGRGFPWLVAPAFVWFFCGAFFLQLGAELPAWRVLGVAALALCSSALWYWAVRHRRVWSIALGTTAAVAIPAIPHALLV